MMPTNPLHLAVIGCGRIGRIHAENLATRVPGARLAGLADVNLDAAQELAASLHVPRAIRDYHELLADPTVDAVAICTATDTHAQIIEEAAAARKPIFCEKPIDLDPRRIRKALVAVEKTAVKFQVGFNRRFDPSFARVQQAVAAGQIGVAHIVRITSRDPAPPPRTWHR